MAKSKSIRASRMGALGFTFITLVCALLTAFSFNRMLEGSKFDNIILDDIVVAKQNIEQFGTFTAETVKIVRWPRDALPEGAFGSIEELLGTETNPQSPKSRERLLANEPVLRHRLAGRESNTELATLLRRGQRAFSIEIDSRMTRSRMIYPNACVDVLTTIRREDTRESVSRTILQLVKVLAVNGSTDGGTREGEEERDVDIVTFSVNPEQGEMITLASRQGQIDLTLRSCEDQGLIESEGTSPRKLLNVQETVSLEAPRAPVRRRRPRRSFRDETPSTPNRQLGRRGRTRTIQFSE